MNGTANVVASPSQARMAWALRCTAGHGPAPQGRVAQGHALRNARKKFANGVLLGWMIYKEPLGAREAMAMAVIFIGVAMVKRSSIKVARRAEPEPAIGE